MELTGFIIRQPDGCKRGGNKDDTRNHIHRMCSDFIDFTILA